MVLPPGVLMRKLAWPSQSSSVTSVLLATAAAGGATAVVVCAQPDVASSVTAVTARAQEVVQIPAKVMGVLEGDWCESGLE